MSTKDFLKQNIKPNFSFNFKVNFDMLKRSLPTKALVEQDFVLHIEDIFDITNNSGLIKLTLGSFNKPLNKYLYINEGKVSYFQGSPIPTSTNIKVHNKLKKMLQND